MQFFASDNALAVNSENSKNFLSIYIQEVAGIQIKQLPQLTDDQIQFISRIMILVFVNSLKLECITCFLLTREDPGASGYFLFFFNDTSN